MLEIICPVCGETLTEKEKSFICENSHCFDKAKEGYVNLLTGRHKPGSEIGDNKDMALSRRQFLSKGYFDALIGAITDYIKELSLSCPVIGDICCGEGYYGDKISRALSCEVFGFDISKEMIKLAAKRKNGITYFVANLASIPVKDNSTDISLHLFAPFHEKEFSRITKKGGHIISVVAGENHLFELKQLLYDTPYKNDEAPPETAFLSLKEKRKITSKIHLASNEDIMALFKMTPYYYHTRDEDKAKLASIEELDITAEFVMFIYQA